MLAPFDVSIGIKFGGGVGTFAVILQFELVCKKFLEFTNFSSFI